MLPSRTKRPRLDRLVALCTVLLAAMCLVLIVPNGGWDGLRGPARVVLTEQGAGPGGSALSPVSSASDAVRAVVPPEAPDAQVTPPPADGVSITDSTDFYAVDGSSLSTLLSSLRERGPSDGHGTWAANTAWVFRWSYQPVSDAGCRVASAKVDLALTYTYPRWTVPADAPPGLVAAWDSYLANVELHEHGHRDIAEAAAADLVKMLEALPAQGSCDALTATARTTASQLLARHAESQRTYDQETGHGEAQGAVLTARASVD
jgi:predicted secreted Zn-dependent protease